MSALGPRLGKLLLARNRISQDDLEQALADQEESHRRLGEELLAARKLDEKGLCQALAEQFELPWEEDLGQAHPSAELLALLPIAYAKQHGIIPLEQDEGRLRLALADPTQLQTLNDLAVHTGQAIDVCLAPAEAITQAIHRHYEQQADQHVPAIEEISDQGDMATDLEPTDLLDNQDEAPLIRFVNGLLTRACKDRASDIHIEPFEQELLVRYRIDGVLYEILRPPKQAQAGIISRIKVMAGLNIAEKRLPQDGRFPVRIAGKDIDVRVSSLPTAYGERIVMRLLDRSAGILGLEELGFDSSLLGQMKQMLNHNHGIILVTGPTGSGKTTTLYAALSRLNTQERNIITVEDPIEYQLPGVSQIQVNPKIELTFAAGLRSILRQDPDVIMVGEVRDAETASMAVQSALTGHLVFSTLHTNDAAGALTRLLEMGVEPYLVASSVIGVLAQRLVRRLCPQCREASLPSEALCEELHLTPEERNQPYYTARGCDACMHIGYKGRTGIYELMPVSDVLREDIVAKRDAATIKTKAVQAGMRTLRAQGLAKAQAGQTSLAEVLRVTQEDS